MSAASSEAIGTRARTEVWARLASEAGLARDARAIYETARARGFPAERLVIFGESLGSAVAVGLSAERPCGGVVLETPAQIAQHAAAIRQQAVASRAMPLGNLTNMTDDERARLGAWIDAGARVER